MLSVKINRLKCQTETYTIRSNFVGHRSMFKRCYFDGDAHWKWKVFTPKLEQQLVAPGKDPLESCQYQKKQMIRISRVSRNHCHTSGRNLKGLFAAVGHAELIHGSSRSRGRGMENQLFKNELKVVSSLGFIVSFFVVAMDSRQESGHTHYKPL